jgi:carbon monoxide dehydrogenase subunit G
MRYFKTEMDIAAPPSRVWEVMSDVEHWHEWTPSITSIERRDNGTFAVGSKALVRQPKFPPALWTVTEIETGKTFTWTSGAPGVHVAGRHSVEPTATGSRAVLELTYTGIFGGLFAGLTREITERYVGYEARGLKARSENPAFRHRGFD